MGRWGLAGFGGVRASGGWDGGEMEIGSKRVWDREVRKGRLITELKGGILTVNLVIRGLRQKQKLKICINEQTNGWAS